MKISFSFLPFLLNFLGDQTGFYSYPWWVWLETAWSRLGFVIFFFCRILLFIVTCRSVLYHSYNIVGLILRWSCNFVCHLLILEGNSIFVNLNYILALSFKAWLLYSQRGLQLTCWVFGCNNCLMKCVREKKLLNLWICF